MALAGETAKPFDDANVPTGTRIDIMVLDKTDSRVQALPPADPANPTPAERTFCRVGVVVQRSDSLPDEIRWSGWKHVSTANYPLISASLDDDLKELHDVEKAALGL